MALLEPALLLGADRVGQERDASCTRMPEPPKAAWGMSSVNTSTSPKLDSSGMCGTSSGRSPHGWNSSVVLRLRSGM